MEQNLIKELKILEPKILNNEKLSEKDLVTIKNAFEEITGQKVHTMMSCAGKLCDVFKRVIVNFLKVNETLIPKPTPIKTIIPLSNEKSIKKIEKKIIYHPKKNKKNGKKSRK
jgi:hypothetical protein